MVEIAKHKHGEYKHVLLTDKEYQKLCEEYGEQATQDIIAYLDEYIEEKSYKSKSHYLAIKRWVVNAYYKQQGEKRYRPRYIETVPSYTSTITTEIQTNNSDDVLKALKELEGNL